MAKTQNKTIKKKKIGKLKIFKSKTTYVKKPKIYLSFCLNKVINWY